MGLVHRSGDRSWDRMHRVGRDRLCNTQGGANDEDVQQAGVRQQYRVPDTPGSLFSGN